MAFQFNPELKLEIDLQWNGCRFHSDSSTKVARVNRAANFRYYGTVFQFPSSVAVATKTYATYSLIRSRHPIMLKWQVSWAISEPEIGHTVLLHIALPVSLIQFWIRVFDCVVLFVVCSSTLYASLYLCAFYHYLFFFACVFTSIIIFFNQNFKKCEGSTYWVKHAFHNFFAFDSTFVLNRVH